jgi:ribosomal-protein-alanine N-acetyltransferase
LKVAETERLILRRLSEEDAPFILELVNDPDWLRYIGDRGVRTLEDARAYVRNGPAASYARFGFGLYRVEEKAGGAPVGICGLLKRDALEDVDLGFALLPRFRGRGYAREAAAAVVALGQGAFGLARIAAVTDPANARSIGVLERLGFGYERMVRLAPDEIELRLFVRRAEVAS